MTTCLFQGLTQIYFVHHFTTESFPNFVRASFLCILSPYTHLCPISCELRNFLLSKALLMVVLFIPKQDFTSFKLLMLLEDTTTTSTKFLTTYWSFPTLYFKPFHVLVKILQKMAHCSRFCGLLHTHGLHVVILVVVIICLKHFFDIQGHFDYWIHEQYKQLLVLDYKHSYHCYYLTR